MRGIEMRSRRLKVILLVFSASLLLSLSGCGDFSLFTALGNEAEGSFHLNPDSANLPVGSEYTFTASGGFPDYTYVILAGLGQIHKNQDWVYRAPDSISGDWEEVTIQASDQVGNSDSATIKVYNRFTLSPANITLYVTDGDQIFTAAGGVSPYSWTLNGADKGSGPTYIFSPSTQGVGTYIISVTDAIGNYNETAVSVLPASGAPLTIDPTAASVLVNDSLTFKAFGGDGPGFYLWSASAGSIAPSGPDKADFTAPGSAGEVTITLSSGAHTPVTATVVVTLAPPDPLVLLPEGASLQEGEQITFIASGGVPPYTFSVGKGGHGTIDPVSGLYTALKKPRDTVTVTDFVLATKTVQVTITQP